MKLPFILAVILLLVSACATIEKPIAPVTRFIPTRLSSYEFAGRISVKQEEKGEYANIRWIKVEGETDITLLSPLGQIVAKIHGTPGGIKLTLADRREFWAQNGETLTRQVLGYTVPVSGLNDWLVGQAMANTPVEQRFRADGLPERIRQDGWLIQYLEYTTVDQMELPKRMMLDREGLEIRLVIDRWNLRAEMK